MLLFLLPVCSLLLMSLLLSVLVVAAPVKEEEQIISDYCCFVMLVVMMMIGPFSHLALGFRFAAHTHTKERLFTTLTIEIHSFMLFCSVHQKKKTRYIRHIALLGQAPLARTTYVIGWSS